MLLFIFGSFRGEGQVLCHRESAEREGQRQDDACGLGGTCYSLGCARSDRQWRKSCTLLQREGGRRTVRRQSLARRGSVLFCVLCSVFCILCSVFMADIRKNGRLKILFYLSLLPLIISVLGMMQCFGRPPMRRDGTGGGMNLLPDMVSICGVCVKFTALTDREESVEGQILYWPSPRAARVRWALSSLRSR